MSPFSISNPDVSGGQVRELNEEQIRRKLHSYGVEWFRYMLPRWRFQPPTASHMSGVWERLIRSVRKAMNAVLSKPGTAIPLETPRTVFAEVTPILNSRPISPASMIQVTWSHSLQTTFFYSVEISPYPPGVFAKEELYSRKQLRNSLLTVFDGDGF